MQIGRKRSPAGQAGEEFSRRLWPERIDAIGRKCVEAGFAMRVVQEAQRLHTLLEFVAQGLGVAIIPDPLCHCSDYVVFKKLKDLELAHLSLLAGLLPGKALEDYIVDQCLRLRNRGHQRCSGF